MKDLPADQCRRQTILTQSLAEKKGWQDSPISRNALPRFQRQDKSNSQRDAENFIFPKSTPPEITKAIKRNNVLLWSWDSVNKSCSQFIILSL